MQHGPMQAREQVGGGQSCTTTSRGCRLTNRALPQHFYGACPVASWHAFWPWLLFWHMIVFAYVDGKLTVEPGVSFINTCGPDGRGQHAWRLRAIKAMSPDFCLCVGPQRWDGCIPVRERNAPTRNSSSYPQAAGCADAKAAVVPCRRWQHQISARKEILVSHKGGA